MKNKVLNMKKSKINYLVLSDIHLGHNINNTENVINNLQLYFKDNYKEFSKLDMICIAGDVFDKLLVSSSIDFVLSTEWLTELIVFCKQHDIILRILEGTPSHDRNQSKVITSIIKKLNIELDYKYIDTLYIEHHNRLGIDILYIPDEYKHKAEDTYKEVLELLTELKLKKVDIAFIHGQFHYQLPMVKLDSSHNMEDYLNIVKYYISVGHIHTPSVYERIIAQGSFDRLAHNEEEDKGGVVITLTEKESSFKFVYNKNAMIFKTYRFDKESIEEITNILDKDLKKMKDKSNIRIISNSEEFLSSNIKDLRLRYPNINIKIEKSKNKEEDKFNIIEELPKIETFSITKDNILDLITLELNKYNLTEKEIKELKSEVINIIDNIP
jgi:hypothetical protein